MKRRKQLETQTTLWVSKKLRAKLYELKRDGETWDEALIRLTAINAGIESEEGS